ncbi:hypothetical protein [uncultured Martelella sp.]|uniref:aldose epimerase family protein n=1 Tax=uncultured Martelella sp. TaxID=392331 RepID=UPI0029C63E76|nr:hypothetical protein [uncultured Martelella sp.]
MAKFSTMWCVRFGASFYTPVDEDLLATGEILGVKDTAFDFTTPKAIGQDIEQLAGVGGEIFAEGSGYDHNLCLDGTDALRFCIDTYYPGSGRRMVMHTSELGVQFYTGGYQS